MWLHNGGYAAPSFQQKPWQRRVRWWRGWIFTQANQTKSSYTWRRWSEVRLPFNKLYIVSNGSRSLRLEKCIFKCGETTLNFWQEGVCRHPAHWRHAFYIRIQISSEEVMCTTPFFLHSSLIPRNFGWSQNALFYFILAETNSNNARNGCWLLWSNGIFLLGTPSVMTIATSLQPRRYPQPGIHLAFLVLNTLT